MWHYVLLCNNMSHDLSEKMYFWSLFPPHFPPVHIMTAQVSQLSVDTVICVLALVDQMSWIWHRCGCWISFSYRGAEFCAESQQVGPTMAQCWHLSVLICTCLLAIWKPSLSWRSHKSDRPHSIRWSWSGRDLWGVEVKFKPEVCCWAETWNWMDVMWTMSLKAAAWSETTCSHELLAEESFSLRKKKKKVIIWGI